jgi:hypothetical protein
VHQDDVQEQEFMPPSPSDVTVEKQELEEVSFLWGDSAVSFISESAFPYFD